MGVITIDESFIGDLEGIPDLTRRAWVVRERILRWTSIPACIGLAPTKTLAKLCNHVAKDAERKPGSYPAELARVCNWSELPQTQRLDLLRRTPAGAVWGIGRRIAARLAEQGIVTALDVARMQAAKARHEWSVVLERTVRELQGVNCISLEYAPPPKQQIACTRSFGHPINTLAPLIEAVSEFASRAAENLRRNNQQAGGLLVFACTSPFRPGPRFNKSRIIQLQPPTANSMQLVSAAIAGLRKIYEPGYQLAKAGVMLMDLSCAASQTDWLFEEPASKRDHSKLMVVMDKINARYGKATVHIASTGQHNEARWRMKQQWRTPRYTTRIDEIPIARA